MSIVGNDPCRATEHPLVSGNSLRQDHKSQGCLSARIKGHFEDILSLLTVHLPAITGVSKGALCHRPP